MKLLIIESVIDTKEFIKFVNQNCNNKQEQVESRLDSLAMDYASKNRCMLTLKEDRLIFHPANLSKHTINQLLETL